jgi:phenylacetate-CoA ligase
VNLSYKAIQTSVSGLWWKRRLKREGRSWSEIELFSNLDAGQQRERLARRLLDQLQYFATFPGVPIEWRESAKIKNPVDLWKVWPSLPIITKKDLRERFEPRFLQAHLNLVGKIDSTGGSTGEPTFFLHDIEMRRAVSAASFFARIQLGWQPGMPTIVLWGSDRDIGRANSLRQDAFIRLGREYLVDGYRMDHKKVEIAVEHLRRLKPVAIYGFTSMLEFLATEVLRSSIPIPPDSVKIAWNGGETVSEAQSAVFQSAFGVPILNLYGGRELGAMAYQMRPGKALRVLRPWLYVEIVDELGRQVRAGETGRMVWTSTICRGTPFLRYEIGDLATFRDNGIDDAGIFAIEELQGRVGSIFKLPNGKSVSALFWNHFWKEFPEVRQFQIVLVNGDSVRILLKGQQFSNDRETQCKNLLRHTLGTTPVDIRWVDEIPRTPQGKLIQVIRETAANN